jgi:hypothetical protein
VSRNEEREREKERERERERKSERAETLHINHKTEQQTYTNAERQKERNIIYKKFQMQSEWKYGWLAVGWNGRVNRCKKIERELEKDRSNDRVFYLV